MRCEGHLCNVCHGGIKGIAYRTHCYHLFCPACAQDNFHRQNACPICGAQLSIENVTETTIGTKCDKIVDQMFQFALGGSDIEESMKLTVAMLQGIEEVSLFVHTQLREQRHAIDRTHREREEHCRAKEEHLIGMVQQYDGQLDSYKIRLEASAKELSDKSSEVAQLQDTLKDKVRKCQAWEKAYANIRAQLLTHSGQHFSGQVTNVVAENPETCAPSQRFTGHYMNTQSISRSPPIFPEQIATSNSFGNPRPLAIQRLDQSSQFNPPKSFNHRSFDLSTSVSTSDRRLEMARWRTLPQAFSNDIASNIGSKSSHFSSFFDK